MRRDYDAPPPRTTFSDRKGRSVVVSNLGALWVEAERLVGAPLDPLEPGLVRALG